MSCANLRATAKTATAPPLWRAMRRNAAPRAVFNGLATEAHDVRVDVVHPRLV
jgi:hypothetical protein